MSFNEFQKTMETRQEQPTFWTLEDPQRLFEVGMELQTSTDEKAYVVAVDRNKGVATVSNQLLPEPKPKTDPPLIIEISGFLNDPALTLLVGKLHLANTNPNYSKVK